MTSEVSQRPGLSAVLALCLLGGLAFLVPQLRRPPGFIDYTDAVHLADGNVAGAAVTARVTTRAPLADLSFDLDRAVAKGPLELSTVMHLHSVLLHLLAAVALLFLLHRLGAGRVGAWCGAALFTLHPSLLETVSVVGLRPAVLAGLCTILALLAVARAARDRSLTHGLVAGLFAVLALAASPFAVILPLLGYLVAMRVGGRGVLAAIGLALPTLGMAAWQGTLGRVADFDPAALTSPLAALVVPRTPAMIAGPALGGAAGSAVGLAAVLLLLAAVLLLRERQPSLATGLGMVAVAVVPAGWIGLGMPDLATYLTVASAALVVAALRLSAGAHLWIGASVGLLMIVVDWQRAPCYRDGPTLWRAAPESPLAQVLLAQHLAATPLDAPRRQALDGLRQHLPQLPVGAERIRGQQTLIKLLGQMDLRGDASLAAAELCDLADRYGVPRTRLECYLIAAECASIEGLEAKLEEYMGRARALAPDHPEVVAAEGERRFGDLAKTVGHADRPGWIAVGDRRLAPIEAAAERALRDDPSCHRALLLKGRLEEAQGRVLNAMPYYEQAIAARPDLVGPRLLLAKLYAESDMMQDAELCVRKAMSDGVEDPRLHYWLGLLMVRQGRADAAQQHLEAYVRNRGASHEARMLLANLLSAQALRQEDQVEPGQLGKLAARIKELNPDDAKGYLVQAAVILKRNPITLPDYQAAIVLIETALARMPGDAEVLRRLAKAHRDVGYKLLLVGQTESAMDHFREYLTLAAPTQSTSAVENLFLKHCQELQERGREGLIRGDGRDAEVALLRLTKLLPQRAGGFFQLGLARLSQRELATAVESFEAAVRLGRAGDEDISFYMLPLLDTLKMLGREDDAKRRGLEFLAKPGRADPGTLQKIRALLQ